MKNSETQMDKIKSRHRALAILRFLDRNPGYRSNLEVLRDWLEYLALTVADDRLVEECRALERVGFLHIDETSEIYILALTQTGCETARGITTSDLVERPTPNCPY